MSLNYLNTLVYFIYIHILQHGASSQRVLCETPGASPFELCILLLLTAGYSHPVIAERTSIFA